jgi:hypothetical protein
VVVMRCTRKLLARLGTPPVVASGRSTTILGDWYADLLYLRPRQLVLLVNAETRLPLLVEARESQMLFVRVCDALATVLGLMGIPATKIQREIAQMGSVQVASTASRSVLGTMNDFRFELEATMAMRGGRTLVDWSLALAETPCKPIGYDCPRSVAIARFAGL